MNRRQLIKQAAGAALSLNWNPLNIQICQILI